MNKLCAPVYYKYRGNLKEEIFMNINFTDDAFRLVVVDDDKFSDTNDENNFCFELRIKKSFFEKYHVLDILCYVVVSSITYFITSTLFLKFIAFVVKNYIRYNV